MKSHLARLTFSACIALAGISGIAQRARAQAVPTDASGGCPIAPTTVDGFFVGGKASLNAVANPADSTVGLTPNCPFFQWSEQMYLWLTSPAPASYGGSSRVMFSPQFFTVTPEDSSGRRQFLPNLAGKALQMRLRATELGVHGLPVVMSRSGHVIEVLPQKKGARPPAVRLKSGVLVNLAKVQRSPEGALQFFNSAGNQVQPRMLSLKPIPRTRILLAPDVRESIVPESALKETIPAHKILVNKVPLFIDVGGSIIDVEPGQADGGVLVSQGGSLIYYIAEVNDVFAYHRSMQGAAAISFTNTIKFPQTAADVAAVVTFAAGKGHTILDANALAIETKSSWIEASAVSTPSDYVQETAIVPTFDKSDPDNWVPNGQAPVKLVMVGLHVVGSTNGHGEMVWATFEHLSNSPNATYVYNATSGQKTVNQNTSGNWLFTPSGSSGPFNLTAASVSGANITGSPIGRAAVLRAKPWGTNDGGNPANAASMNTQVISSNASVIARLDLVDVRRNYFQVGTTWTIGGAPPNSTNQVGTNSLANSTIETFVQGSTASTPSLNCFSCHATNTVSVSHIYDMLTPLP
jgi:hypothetical protein